jgi:hypothetical protein
MVPACIGSMCILTVGIEVMGSLGIVMYAGLILLAGIVGSAVVGVARRICALQRYNLIRGIMIGVVIGLLVPGMLLVSTVLG